MTVSLARRAGTTAAISAAALGLVFAATVPASAHGVTTNYNNACMGDPNSLIAGNVHQPLQAHSMSVAHSSSTPGTYTIQWRWRNRHQSESIEPRIQDRSGDLHVCVHRLRDG